MTKLLFREKFGHFGVVDGKIAKVVSEILLAFLTRTRGPGRAVRSVVRRLAPASLAARLGPAFATRGATSAPAGRRATSALAAR